MKQFFRGPIWVSLLLIPFAGCLDSAEGQDQDPMLQRPIGMGLAIPDDLPLLSGFLEDPEDLAVLEDFLTTHGMELLEGECGRPDRGARIPAWVEAERYVDAIYNWINACAGRGSEGNAFIASDAMRDGNEREVMGDLHSRAVERIASTSAMLSQFSGPSNAVEAEVLQVLEAKQEWNAAATRYGLHAWSLYENSTPPDDNLLRSSFLNLISPRLAAEAVEVFFNAYPWKNEPCLPPDMGVLVARVNETLSTAVNLGRMHATPEELTSGSGWFARLDGIVIAEFEYFRDHGWWVSLLATEVTAEIHLAYWENRTATTPLPSIEEAQFLLASYRNQTRTIWTEDTLRDVIYYLGDELNQEVFPWETHLHNGAYRFMGTMALRWPYAELDCPG